MSIVTLYLFNFHFSFRRDCAHRPLPSLELVGDVPARLIEDKQGVSTAMATPDRVERRLHGVSFGWWHEKAMPASRLGQTAPNIRLPTTLMLVNKRQDMDGVGLP
jgi:hypothetical protein